jgi:hypothetical protein
VSTRRCEIYDDMASVGSLVADGEWLTDVRLEDGYAVWIARGRSPNTSVAVEYSSMDGVDQYRFTNLGGRPC